MSNVNSNQTPAVLANALVAKGPTVPTYVALANRISEELKALGVEPTPQKLEIDGVPGNKQWACWEHPTTKHKVYLSRSKNGPGVIHTTLKLDRTVPGYIDPKGSAPGKIESFFVAREAEVLAHLLPIFAGTTEKLRGREVPGPVEAPTA